MLPEKTVALGEQASQSTLKTLAEIVQGNPPIRGKYTRKIRRGRTRAPWYYASGAKSSYDAARFFTDHGNATNLIAIVNNGLVTLDELERFLGRTPLTECNRGRVENAVRRLRKAYADAEAKAADAAGFSGGNGATGELSEMIAASNQTFAYGGPGLSSAHGNADTSGPHDFAQSRQ